jgi:hypothetical protein
VIVETALIFLTERGVEIAKVLAHRVQHTMLAIHPVLFLLETSATVRADIRLQIGEVASTYLHK